MKISAELTFSTLQDNFEGHITYFIKKPRVSGRTILENPLSTQIFGEYAEVIRVLNADIETAFRSMANGLLFVKIIESDGSNYEPHF